MEHPHAKLARIPVGAVGDDSRHIGLVDRNLQVHHICGPKLSSGNRRLTNQFLLRFEHEGVDRLIAQRNGDLLRLREEAGMIEVQVQPLWNYHQEREYLTRESHAGFKERREALRNQIARTVPLFGFYRDLLRWLFLSPAEPAPTFESVEIVVIE